MFRMTILSHSRLLRVRRYRLLWLDRRTFGESRLDAPMTKRKSGADRGVGRIRPGPWVQVSGWVSLLGRLVLLAKLLRLETGKVTKAGPEKKGSWEEWSL